MEERPMPVARVVFSNRAPHVYEDSTAGDRIAKIELARRAGGEWLGLREYDGPHSAEKGVECILLLPREAMVDDVP